MDTDALAVSSSACLICGRGGAGGRPAIHATPCCSASFCTHCLKSTAAAAGKLFRCPSCRDEHGFLAHAKALGVKVLDLTPAYADDADDALMVVVKACSAARCLSPRGREFDATDIKPTRTVDLSAWRLVSCFSCGQSAVHAGCSAKRLGPLWRCDPCGGDGDLPAPAEEEAFVPFRRRDKVEARFKGGPVWYSGVIVGGNAEDGYRVKYDDDGQIETVPNVVRIRRLTPPPEPAARPAPPPEPPEVVACEEDEATAESPPSSPEEPRRKPEDDETAPPEAVGDEKLDANYSSQYVGVNYHGGPNCSNPWFSKISECGTPKRLGSFATEEEAARAYDSRARILGKPVNFPGAGETQARKRKAKPAETGGDAPAEKKRRLQAQCPRTAEPTVESVATSVAEDEPRRRDAEARRAAAAVDVAASVAADGTFDAAVAARLRAVDDALGELETLLRGPDAGAGLGALLAPTAARYLALYRAQPSSKAQKVLENNADDIAVVKYLARASPEDARKSGVAIAEDLRADGRPRLLLCTTAAIDIFHRLRSPSGPLLDAIGRSEFPDFEGDARRSAALVYVRAAMAKRSRKRKCDAVTEDPPEAGEENGESDSDDSSESSESSDSSESSESSSDSDSDAEIEVGDKFEYKGKMWFCCRENDTIMSIAKANGLYEGRHALLAASAKRFGSDLKFSTRFKAMTCIELPRELLM